MKLFFFCFSSYPVSEVLLSLYLRMEMWQRWSDSPFIIRFLFIAFCMALHSLPLFTHCFCVWRQYPIEISISFVLKANNNGRCTVWKEWKSDFSRSLLSQFKSRFPRSVCTFTILTKTSSVQCSTCKWWMVMMLGLDEFAYNFKLLVNVK